MVEESEMISADLVRHHASLLWTTGKRDRVGDHLNPNSVDRQRVYLLHPTERAVT